MEQQYEGKKKQLEVQLASARSKQQEHGLSPRERGMLAEFEALFLTYKWGYTTSKIVQTMLRRTSGGYLKRLTKKGLLVKTATQSGIPRYFYTLSRDGLAQVEARVSKLLKYIEINPQRVNQSLMNHNLICQKLTLSAVRDKQISQYQTERQYFAEGLKKIPDCIWQDWDQGKIGVEVELNQKWDMDLHRFLLGIWETLENADNPLGIKRFIIFSSSPAIIRNYKAAVSPGQYLPKYRKDDRDRWVIVGQLEVPEWLSTCITFQMISKDIL